MNDRTGSRSFVLAALISLTAFLPGKSNATIVQFQTVMGTFEVNLYDNATPQTVANFLAYLNNNDYSGSIYHRSVPGFIIQGGGFTFDMALPLNAVPARPPVSNEPEFSNVRGTISMAKLSGQPDSATSQWFFNLANNSANLDAQNGGFTVFGEVVGSGMDVIDSIAALPTYSFDPPLGDLPLRDYSAADFGNNVPVAEEHLIIITAIAVSDSTVDTAAGLNPPRNTTNSGGGSGGGGGGGGGGGNLTAWAVLMLLAMLLGQHVTNRRSRTLVPDSWS